LAPRAPPAERGGPVAPDRLPGLPRGRSPFPPGPAGRSDRVRKRPARGPRRPLMSGEPRDELVNVYDAAGAGVGARPRDEAKRAGLAGAAINLLLVDGAGRVLLQRRPRDKENGGHWDKSVGGHVGAGEAFDAAAVREAGEELFDDAGSAAVRLLPTLDAVRDAVRSADLR